MKTKIKYRDIRPTDGGSTPGYTAIARNNRIVWLTPLWFWE